VGPWVQFPVPRERDRETEKEREREREMYTGGMRICYVGLRYKVSDGLLCQAL
jgi:hypothetical protein